MANARCPVCGWEASVLGTLGSLRHYRCQDCGAQFSRTIRRRVKKTAPLPRARVRWTKRGGRLYGVYGRFRAVVWDLHGSVDRPMAYLFQYKIVGRNGVTWVQGNAGRILDAMRRVEEGMKTVSANPLTKGESNAVLESARYQARLARAARGPYRSQLLGIAEGEARVVRTLGRGKAKRRASEVESAIHRMSMRAGGPMIRDAHRTIRRNGKCLLNGAGKKCSYCRKKTVRRNRPIDTAWTGKKADFVSSKGDYGSAPYSELAMHTGASGARIVRYALFSDADRWPWVTWAHIETSTGQVLDGTPGEVLPAEVRRKLGGFGNEKMPMAARLKK